MKRSFFSFFDKKWNFNKISNDIKYDSFFSSKLSKWKFFLLSYYFITMALCPYLFHLNSDFIELNENAFYYVIFSLCFFNLFMFGRIVTLRDYKIDFFLNYLLFFCKNIFLSISLFFIKISKLSFFRFFKFSKYSYISDYIWQKLSSIFVIWRPLFKRLSYFGNYKLTRSKFNNLK